MIVAGQLCLLTAFVAVSYASFACLFGTRWRHGNLLRSGVASAIAGVVALTFVMITLGWALLVKDFNFNYVAQYSSRLLPWHYSLSALWVGQAGSLLLWTWMLGILSLGFRFWPSKRQNLAQPDRREQRPLRDATFGILMAYCGFLTATMVFAADPMEANIAPGSEGAGLSPLLQHPAMLIHPPIVFLGYATWAVPCALAIAALGTRRREDDEDLASLSAERSLDSTWVRVARPWALSAWTILGGGILLGAYWSYEELGWGGYWAWDPVENGSLIPWLIGTALIHALMVWQYCGMLKKASIALAIATFCMCNFATFLTRSGIFSSLHAFSQSPIGWLFLGLMLMLGVGGVLLIVRHRHCLTGERKLTSVWTREAFVILSMLALLLLAVVTVGGTLSVALSEAIVGRRIMVGPEFYNHVMIPIGVVLLTTMAGAPLLRWGSSPSASEKRAFLYAAVAALIPTCIAWSIGVRHPLSLTVGWLAACCLTTHLAPVVLESWKRNARRPWTAVLPALAASRRLYASFVIHLGFVCIVVGVTGSSLGSRRHELVMKQGEVVTWAGRSIRFRRLIERELPDKFIVEAELEVSRNGETPIRLLPAQHLHRLQDQWTTEVAIGSSWSGDFYTILHNGEGRDQVRLTLVDNPLMRCMWLGGWVIAVGTCIRLWPVRRHKLKHLPIKPPHPVKATKQKRRQLATTSV